MASRLKVWAQLGRISNLPTVVTNVFAGAALGAFAAGSFNYIAVILATLSGCSFYLLGMVMNDLFDLPVDRRERSERPLVTGKASLGEARFLMWASAALGFLFLLPVNITAIWCGIALFFLIVLYNAFHHSSMLALPIMGLCRVMLYALGATAVAGPQFFSLQLFLYSMFLFLFVFMITAIATNENHDDQSPSLIVIGMSMLGLLALGQIRQIDKIGYGGQTESVFVLFWALCISYVALKAMFKKSLKSIVMSLIASICLLDALILVSLGHTYLACGAVLCFILTKRAHRKISGT